MDLKRLVTHFTYRIEPKPEGGFIARASDPNLPPLEAATRWELQEKIQQNISAALATEFPELKLPLEQKQLKASFHIERKPDGGFLIHSTDANGTTAEAAEHEIESKFLEKFVGFAGKHLMSDEMSQALAGGMASGDIKVFVKRTTLADAANLNLANSAPNSTTPPPGEFLRQGPENLGSHAVNPAGAMDAITGTTDSDSPIRRNPSGGNSAVLRFLIALLIIGAMMYFYLHYR